MLDRSSSGKMQLVINNGLDVGHVHDGTCVVGAMISWIEGACASVEWSHDHTRRE